MLHVAAGYGSEFCVPYLIEKGADITAKDGDGILSIYFHRIPLHESAHNGTLSIFKVLLDAGSDKDAVDDVFYFFLIMFLCYFFNKISLIV